MRVEQCQPPAPGQQAPDNAHMGIALNRTRARKYKKPSAMWCAPGGLPLIFDELLRRLQGHIDDLTGDEFEVLEFLSRRGLGMTPPPLSRRAAALLDADVRAMRRILYRGGGCE